MKAWIFLGVLVFINLEYLLAQNYFGLLHSGKHFANVGIEANPHLNANVDYMYRPENLNPAGNRLGVLAQFNLPLFTENSFDFDVRIGAGYFVSFSKSFKMISGVSWGFHRTVDLNGRYFSTGFKIDLLPGYYGQKWTIAPHLSLDYRPLLRIKHSTYSRSAFQDIYHGGTATYSGPKDGWFYQNYLLVQSGIAFSFVQPLWNINMTAGFQHHPNKLGLITLPDIGILPFYGELNFGYLIDEK